MPEPILLIEKLSVHFPKEGGNTSWVVRDVNLKISSSEIFGLIGESGSGKTMLSLAVIGLLPEAAIVEGSIRYLQKELLTMSEDEIRRLRGDRMAMIFQDPLTSFNPTIRIGYQVTEPFVIHKGESSKRAVKRAPELLSRVRISDPDKRAEQYSFQLSGGMLQRAMIASAISMRPDILIADESTSGLDVTIQKGVLKLFKKMRDELGTTVILITHDLGVVAETCDRVAVMYAGEIMEIGSANEIIHNPYHPYTKALLRCTPDIDMPSGNLESIPGTLPSTEDNSIECRFKSRCRFASQICEQHPNLDLVGDQHEVRCWNADIGA